MGRPPHQQHSKAKSARTAKNEPTTCRRRSPNPSSRRAQRAASYCHHRSPTHSQQIAASQRWARRAVVDLAAYQYRSKNHRRSRALAPKPHSNCRVLGDQPRRRDLGNERVNTTPARRRLGPETRNAASPDSSRLGRPQRDVCRSLTAETEHFAARACFPGMTLRQTPGWLLARASQDASHEPPRPDRTRSATVCKFRRRLLPSLTIGYRVGPRLRRGVRGRQP